MTSVSRSEHDDETAEGTGVGASETRESQLEPSAATPVRAARSTRATPPKATAAKTAAAKTAAAKTTAAKTTAAKSAATKTAAAKSAAMKTTVVKLAAATSASANTDAGDATPVPADGDAATPAASKRTAASRTASAKAAAARGEAAKTTRAPRASAATSQSATTGRAASAASARQAQRVAAALTTETTAAERPARKAPESAAAAVAEPSQARSEIDEQTVERLPNPAPAPVAAAEPETAPVEAAPLGAATVEAEPVQAEPVQAAPADVVPAPLADEDRPAPPATAGASTAASIAATAGIVATGSAAQAVALIAAPKKSSARKKRMLRPARIGPGADAPKVLAINGLVKRFGENTAVDGITLEVRAGSFFGLVGPNGAGKTTTLSMVTGLLKPDAGTVRIHDIDVWANPRAAKRATGVLPDRLRLFDRLTGAQLLYYSGVLRGLDGRTVRERSADLITAFGLDDAVDRLVADYSAGMTKKIALACAMIHSPRLLVLDEPFESVDPVSAANLTEILERYVAGGGTVVLSSHGMDLIERVCDSAAIIVAGRVLAAGTLDEVRAGQTLEDRFVELAGGRKAAEGMEWLHSFSD